MLPSPAHVMTQIKRKINKVEKHCCHSKHNLLHKAAIAPAPLRQSRMTCHQNAANSLMLCRCCRTVIMRCICLLILTCYDAEDISCQHVMFPFTQLISCGCKLESFFATVTIIETFYTQFVRCFVIDQNENLKRC